MEASLVVDHRVYLMWDQEVIFVSTTIVVQTVGVTGYSVPVF